MMAFTIADCGLKETRSAFRNSQLIYRTILAWKLKIGQSRIASRRLLTRAALFWHGPQSRDREGAVEEVPHKSLWLVDFAALPFA